MSDCSHNPGSRPFGSATGANDTTVSKAAAIFSAMGDPTRLRLLDALSRGEMCVRDLALVGRVSQSAVSHQLQLLRDRGLVSFTREGNRAIYRLADDHVRTLLAQGIAHAEEELR